MLTPAKNVEEQVSRYFDNLAVLTYPQSLLSLGVVVSDSLDKVEADTLTWLDSPWDGLGSDAPAGFYLETGQHPAQEVMHPPFGIL